MQNTDVVAPKVKKPRKPKKPAHPSGFWPLGHRLLVLPDSVELKTKSGIVLVTETTGREEMAQVKGTLAAVGDGCWKDTPTADWAKAGDRIVYGKYAGLLWEGADGRKYRILNDLDVVGLVTKENVVCEVVEAEPVEEPTPLLENSPTEYAGLIQIANAEDEAKYGTE
jgi:co-chaperonin GroES (HSP10)